MLIASLTHSREPDHLPLLGAVGDQPERFIILADVFHTSSYLILEKS